MLDTLHCHHEKTGEAEATNAHKLLIEMDELQWKALSATPRPKQPRNEERAALQKGAWRAPKRSSQWTSEREWCDQIAEATAE